LPENREKWHSSHSKFTLYTKNCHIHNCDIFHTIQYAHIFHRMMSRKHLH